MKKPKKPFGSAMKKQYTIEEAAEILKVSVKIVRRKIAADSSLAEKIKNRYFICEENLKKMIEASKNERENSDSESADLSYAKKNDNVNFINIDDEWDNDGWTDATYRNGYNFIDLFSGAGGLSCGLVMAGFFPVGAVEISENAVNTYNRNFSHRKIEHYLCPCDIRDPESKSALYARFADRHIDLIAGGFPCQGFSMAGNRIVDDPRNSLYLEMLEIVKHIRPDFVICENVEGLRSMLGGRVEQKILSDYKDAGYEMSVTVLNSADYYVPQIRKRVIFIGNRIGAKNYHPLPLLSAQDYRTLGEGIGRFIDMPENKEINHIFSRHSQEMQERITAVPEGKSLFGNYSDAWKKSPWDKPSCTVKENHGGVNLHPRLPRVLTPRELAALQSFPDDFIFTGAKKDQLVQIGNAVPPLLGKAIGIAIMKSLSEHYGNKQ